MAFFRRTRKTQEPDSPPPTEADTAAPAPDDTPEIEGRAAPDRPDGPFDRSEVDDLSEHLDLGALLVKGTDGMQLRLEINQEQQQVTSVTALLGDSHLQLQAFAAPRSEGLWAGIRDEIAASIVAGGGTATEVEGPVGIELHAQMVSTDASGRRATAPVRFLGVDGPRWFLRGVVSGRAAAADETPRPLLDLFRSTVVVRGSEPMAPRELLPLTLPVQEDPAPGAPAPAGAAASGAPEGRAPQELNPFERGPEITEVR